MPIAKNYLRYESAARFGVVASDDGNAVLLPTAHHVAVPALEDIIVWNIKTGEKLYALEGDEDVVTCLTLHPDGKQLAAGYQDGTIRIWSLAARTVDIVFSGHRSRITCLRFNDDGSQLVSGSQDTTVIAWDVLNESGLFRLRGHKGPINDIAILESRRLIVSCSKDTFVRFWDLDTQACVYVLVGHRTDVTGLAFLDQQQRLITTAADHQLRVWQLGYSSLYASSGTTSNNDAADEHTPDAHLDEVKSPVVAELQGTVARSTHDRALGMAMSPDHRTFAVFSADSTIDLFRIRSTEELQRRLARKKKKAAAKAGDQDTPQLDLNDEIVLGGTVMAQGKVRSFAWQPTEQSGNKLASVTLLSTNALETHAFERTGKGVTSQRTAYFSHSGHRKPVRSIALSSDEQLVVSGSNSTAKLWSAHTGRCIRTLESGYGVTCCFVPGNKHIIIGTKDGWLRLFDVASGALLHEVEAHQGAIWGLDLTPDETGFVTGSADKTVKFWDFELVSHAAGGSKQLSISHTKTLKMTDEVTCLRFSPNQKLLAVALLDTTVKVFFSDTLKFFLSLYGHKLPVMCMDISQDSTLLATGSPDKNLKIWGLDFGDCHKSFLAHTDSVTSVRFAGSSHYVFSTSKDGVIKQWDADVFTQIQTLKGHKSVISCSAISSKGGLFVTGSHDRSIRVWRRSREMLNVEEEAEMERETEYEKEQAEREAMEARAQADDDEAGRATRRSAETLKATDRLLEALLVAIEEDAKGPDAPTNPLLTAYRVETGAEYLRHNLEAIKSSEMEEAMLLLPYSQVSELLKYLHGFLTRNLSIEKASRCLLFLVRVHFNQVVADRSLLNIFDDLRSSARAVLGNKRDQLGKNLAGLQFIRRHLNENSTMVDLEVAAPPPKKSKRNT